MKRIFLIVTLFASSSICVGNENKAEDDDLVWSSPSLLAIVSKQDSRLGDPLIFRASIDLTGALPWRLDVSDKRPLWDYSKKVRTLPWSEEMGGSYVFVVLPCHEDQGPKTVKGPSYLFAKEKAYEKNPGYYTDVYRAQYQFGRGSEFLFLNIKNSKKECGVEAYRALEVDGKSRLVRLPNEKVDFEKVFVCEAELPYC